MPLKTKMLYWILSLIFYSLNAHPFLWAETTSAAFKKHLKNTFIETGSLHGEGINKALEAGYKEVYSIELSPHFYQYCSQRFKDNPKVHVHLGDSGAILKEILQKINEPVVFWLDSHYSRFGTALGDSSTPILRELEAIAAHPIKSHTILIDDVRLFGTVEFDFIELNAIIAIIKRINPNYSISFEDGYVAKDVLVAQIQSF